MLEPGKEEPKAKDVALGAGEKIYFELKSFKKSDYCIKITDTSKEKICGSVWIGYQISVSIKQRMATSLIRS